MSMDVYLVDDDADICRLAAVSFQALSEHRLTTFQDGAQLLAAIEVEMPHLLILDVMMPGKSGPELLDSLRNQFGDRLAPAVFLTAKVQPSEIAELKCLGVVEVLPKPFAPRDLVDRIDQLLKSA